MEWKTFIQSSGKWLLLDKFLFNVVCTMGSLYYINVFSKVFTVETLSLQRVLQSSVGFLISSLIVYKAIEYIKPSMVLLCAITMYPILFTFTISNEAFLLTTATIGTTWIAVIQIYQSRICAENVIQEHRVRWNNISGLVTQVGVIVGSGLGSLALLDKFPFWLAHMILWILYDIGTILVFTLIKMKKIKY